MRLRAWLELTRCSNLPTVWSNVAAGIAWGVHASSLAHAEDRAAVVLRPVPDLWTVVNSAFVLIVAGSLLYTAGMVLNDAFDAKIDAKERPSRPIPSGRVSRRTAFTAGLAMLALGVLACWPYAASPWTMPLAVVIAVAILIYNAFHARIAATVVLVPIARGLLAFLAALTVGGAAWGPTWIAGLHGASLVVFTLMVSAWARGEVAGERTRYIGLGVAGIALVDAALLAAVGQWPVAGFCVACFCITVVAQRFVPGS
ncbi:MAG: UbiA family prenyltransferase [Planctomycetota bacterium]